VNEPLTTFVLFHVNQLQPLSSCFTLSNYQPHSSCFTSNQLVATFAPVAG